MYLLAAVLALVESLIRRVTLTADALEIRSLFRNRTYARSHIVMVSEPIVGPAAVMLQSKGWTELPEIGQRIGDSLRLWLGAVGEAGSSRPTRSR